MWRDGETPAGVHDSVLDNLQGGIEQIGGNRYRLHVDITKAAGVMGRTGEYLWTVGLVQIDPVYADLGDWAEPARLRYEAPGPSDSGITNGGGNGASGGGEIN